MALVGTALIATAQGWAGTGDSAATDQMRAEGEAGGLEDTELETFIRACLSDLPSVELHNIEQR